MTDAERHAIRVASMRQWQAGKRGEKRDSAAVRRAEFERICAEVDAGRAGLKARDGFRAPLDAPVPIRFVQGDDIAMTMHCSRPAQPASAREHIKRIRRAT